MRITHSIRRILNFASLNFSYLREKLLFKRSACMRCTVMAQTRSVAPALAIAASTPQTLAAAILSWRGAAAVVCKTVAVHVQSASGEEFEQKRGLERTVDVVQNVRSRNARKKIIKTTAIILPRLLHGSPNSSQGV